jgi:hypothetical protein
MPDRISTYGYTPHKTKCSYCGIEIKPTEMGDTEVLFDEILCSKCAKNNYLKIG